MDSPALREALHRLAANHRWSWAASCRDLLASLPGAAQSRHPVTVVADLNAGQLDQLLADEAFVGRVAAETGDLDAALEEPASPQIAYCSPEFGIDSLLPQYAGGLGILAGDHLKAAADLRVPLVGIGLFYRNGYFEQQIDDAGQSESYPTIDPVDVGAIDTHVVVRVPLPGRHVAARVWRIDVGRIPLLLLDTQVVENGESDRSIGDRLYGGDRAHRLDQEMVLGVGGARALAAIGWDPTVHHLNEGHAGFIAMELIDRVISGGDLPQAMSKVRQGLVFTTHTPVPAGIDCFHRDLVIPYLEPWAARWGVPVEEIWELGLDPDDEHRFNMAAMALRLSSRANGVSRLHGEVSRGMFAGTGIGDEITSVTNGVHARTWVGADLQATFDEVLGPAWADGDPSAWDRVWAIADDRLAHLRSGASRRLAEVVSVTTGRALDPDALIIGFARRFAPYKRATLLFHEIERLREMLGDDARPVHFVFAGKAHPQDDHGKSLVSEVVSFASSPQANNRLTFVPGYDMRLARALVEGCDIWLNNPIRPREASGTSGEKAALNGVLNCSILDGWWAEMYDGANGWAIASSDDDDPELRDAAEATALIEILGSIRDMYHDERPVFFERIRHAWRTLGPRVTAARMVREYMTDIYEPTLEQARRS
ncbi:MAG TPA: alpha-glucan family phosphorylase [Acidimicrobiia bacterium]|nr:alpha-glucan family phosphorylase [Acidimicrobiia bacterium]